MRSKVIIVIILFFPIVYILSCNRNQKPIKQADFKFPATLSSIGFFKGKISDLHPDTGITTYELSATLFTDYSEKQRLIKLPKGKKMIVKGDGLPVFPEGTIIAKTFFYSKSVLKRKLIIETRILILKSGKWFAGTYKWNKTQTEANYTAQGSIVPLTFIDAGGKPQKINYRIPSAADCQSCHRSADEIIPIGPKVMNLNREVKSGEKEVNQLELFRKLNLVSYNGDFNKISRLADYEDKRVDLKLRARAYLEINCAHCHNPNGLAYRQSVMFGYQIPLKQSGIEFNKNNIIDRMGTMGPYHMPKLGTTVLDKDGVELIKRYINEIN